MTLGTSFLFRKKKFDQTSLEQTKLDRVLGIVDITALGVSCTLGNGIYVLAGDVIANYAGPAITLSFIIAGLATGIAGICYAEFGARLPRSGSAYVYIYVSIGEFVAFILGWDLILEYVIGVSSGASSLSRYIDSLADNRIQLAIREVMPMNIEYLSPYPDFLAFAFIMLVTVFMVVGVKESSFLNKIFTIINILVIIFIFISGLFKSDLKNWSIDVNTIGNWTDTSGKNQTCDSSSRCGNGGWAPFGFDGVIKGAAKCFYAYIGFDAIASSGEEVKNPKRNLPLGIALTLLISSLCYCSSSIVISLMIPYYIVDPEIPLPQAYEYVGWEWAKTLVSVGAIASLITCLYAAMFPMPRVVYSLSSDGLIFKSLSILMPRLKTPVTAAIFSGLFAGVLALIFDLNQLIDMMSIGTLMAYSVVAVCVLVLRYKPSGDDEVIGIEEEGKKPIEYFTFDNAIQNHQPLKATKRTLASVIFGYSDEPLISRLFRPRSKKCNEQTSRLVNVIAVFSVVVVFFISFLLSFIELLGNPTVVYVAIGILSSIAVLNSVIIQLQPQDDSLDTFKVPLISFLPFISVFVNIYLMMSLSLSTWIPFGIWFVLGLVVYFSYGVRHSHLAPKIRPTT